MSFAGFININGADYPIASTLYKECTTYEGDSPKIVSFADFDTLLPGVMVAVKFTYSNTATNPQLKVGTTEAKTIYVDGASSPGSPVGTTPATSWSAGSLVLFVYDGASWRMVNSSKALRAEMLSADDNLQAQINTINNTTVPNINAVINTKEPKLLKFKNKTATFTSGNGITNFGYRATVACTGVTTAMTAVVAFSGNDAGSGDFAPYCQTYNGGVYLYAAAAKSNVTIPCITCWSMT